MLEIRPRPLTHPDAQAIVEQIQQYYVEIYGGRDRDEPDPAQFTLPDGLFLVGYLDGVPVASGGWRRRPDGTVEIKRMFVVDSVRGRGAARELLAELETTAARAGATAIVLNTGYRQPAAMALYESSGYVHTDERYGIYAEMSGSRFYRKQLATPGS